MLDKIEINKLELELLILRLAEAETERDNIIKELGALKSSLTKTRTSISWR